SSCSVGLCYFYFFFFSSRRRHTRLVSDWSSDVCSSDLKMGVEAPCTLHVEERLAGGLLPVDMEGARSFRPHLLPMLTCWGPAGRSEERRVGKEWRSRWSPYH